MKITEKLYIDRWELEGPLTEVIENLQHRLEQYKDTHTNLQLSVYAQTIYDDTTFGVDLHGEREETEAEIKARERKAAIDKRNEEWREKETLRKLKEKYEDKNVLDK